MPFIASLIEQVQSTYPTALITFEHGSSQELTTDFSLLQKVLKEVLCNAARYTEPGTAAAVTVSLDGDAEQGYRLQIRDRGIGIDAAYTDQVFQLFKRLHAREVYPGSGIGLTIAQRATQLLGGELYIDSTYTDGVSVVVEFVCMKE